MAPLYADVRAYCSRVKMNYWRARLLIHSSYAYGCVFARWNLLLLAAKKNNNAANFFVSLKRNNSEGFIGTP